MRGIHGLAIDVSHVEDGYAWDGVCDRGEAGCCETT